MIRHWQLGAYSTVSFKHRSADLSSLLSPSYLRFSTGDRRRARTNHSAQARGLSGTLGQRCRLTASTGQVPATSVRPRLTTSRACTPRLTSSPFRCTIYLTNQEPPDKPGASSQLTSHHHRRRPVVVARSRRGDEMQHQQPIIVRWASRPMIGCFRVCRPSARHRRAPCRAEPLRGRRARSDSLIPKPLSGATPRSRSCRRRIHEQRPYPSVKSP
jgi:hypothetical protein